MVGWDLYVISRINLLHYPSIINRFFLSLDLFSIEMDPFQYTPWLIITSVTYQPALDSA